MEDCQAAAVGVKKITQNLTFLCNNVSQMLIIVKSIFQFFKAFLAP